ncbi:beta-1,6-N-acetylglucosaminyltransferase [Vreelandella populi]|uniref:beta-1,6-N-acetylglucosaminyltransferase n=1 Tax=Vreelandella populi TaxID=2498858 RepID=UPI000F8C464B|nr:beta-1,6-N-acetylglucosaminyltransferase [Halomonas populi]RUR42388.1 hypothetical protein ELY25_00385 [Halomonas populi]
MADLSITYLVLAHKSTSRVTRLVDKLLLEDANGQVIIHFDKKSGKAPYKWLSDYYAKAPRCHVLLSRVNCGWGQWSLVEATLRMLRYAQDSHKTDYYYLLSEYCYPTQRLSALKEHLEKHRGTNFIECEDSSWIKGGIREDRYLYRHFLDKRKYPRLHRWTYKWQKWLGFKLEVPKGLTIRFGSQWWCLTQEAIDYVLLVEPTYRYFFRWTWIPDEMVFQTIFFSFLKESLFNNILTYSYFDKNGKAGSINDKKNIPDKFFFARKWL